MYRPVVLLIIDGLGIAPPGKGNAVANARTPTLNRLFTEFPSMLVAASGTAVGLTWGDVGSSEVGHTIIGAGRIISHGHPRIISAIDNGTFYENQVLGELMREVKSRGTQLHVAGIASHASPHGDLRYLIAVAELAKEVGLSQVYLHIFSDGRDAPKQSLVNYLTVIERHLKEIGVGSVASVIGRYYAMDRDMNWDRTRRAYELLTEGLGKKTSSVVAGVKSVLAENNGDEERMEAVAVVDGQGNPVVVQDGDGIIFTNLLPDRAKQLASTFLSDFLTFRRAVVRQNLLLASLESYGDGLPLRVAFSSPALHPSLGEVVSEAGLRQLRISESDKHTNITYHLDGGRILKLPQMDVELIPSTDPATHALVPAMNLPALTQTLLAAIQKRTHDVMMVNIPNPDAVGHSGNIGATVRAVEITDQELGRVVDAVLDAKGALVVTSDHGMAEEMLFSQSGEAHRYHTDNPVPLIVVAKELSGKGRNDSRAALTVGGLLTDVAPTVLELLGIAKPVAMTGVSVMERFSL